MTIFSIIFKRLLMGRRCSQQGEGKRNNYDETLSFSSSSPDHQNIVKYDHKMGVRMQLTAFLNSNIGIVLLIIALVTDYWAGRESSKIYVYEGLWKKCTDHLHEDGKPVECKPIAETFGHYTNEYLAVIIFLFMACGLHVIDFLMSIVLFCTDNIKLEKALAVLQLLILICTMIGLSVYATIYDGNYYGLKWSCALGWGSTLCMFAAFVFLLIDIDRKK